MRIGYIQKPEGSFCAVAVRPDETLLDVLGLVDARIAGTGLRTFGDIIRDSHIYENWAEMRHPYYGVQPFHLAQVWPEMAPIVNEAVEEFDRGRTNVEREAFLFPADTPLLCPFPRPKRVLAIGRNYGEHAKELGNAVPEEPIVFLKASTCVIGPNEPIRIPEWVGRVDYEAELLVVLGEGGRHIPESEAMNHVVAYSVFNDVTARERQRAAQEKKQPWFLAKSMDTSGPLGPWLVTKDDLPDPQNLRISLTVNGETKQNDTTGSMIYSIPFLIAYLSKQFALHAGDVIATGTPSGVGPIRPGDVVEATIEGIGTLRNPVIAD
ncbi:MAG: fumarylacetoacetate hydrolase family protein [Capsulimonadales bacterium]|nr:fumarylacetoacetate hydrolase family protein [Capsulimonadales bacterium]